MIVTDPVVYMQNRTKGIEHEWQDPCGVWALEEGRWSVAVIETLCKENRLRTEPKPLEREMYELLTRLRNHIKHLEFDDVGIKQDSVYYHEIQELLKKQKEKYKDGNFSGDPLVNDACNK